MNRERLKVPANAWENRPKAAVLPLAYRCREAAAALGLSERTVWALGKSGEIRTVRLPGGGAVLYPVAELCRWLREQAKAQAVSENTHGGAQEDSR